MFGMGDKMKKIFLIILSLFVLGFYTQEELLNVYKTGTLKLVADSEFAKNTDWEYLFSDYGYTLHDRPDGTYKDMVISENGSIFVCNRSRYNIYRFDKDGNFINSFGKQGNGEGEFYHRPNLSGTIGSKYLITYDNQGNLNLFDIEGNFVKFFKLDYLPTDCIGIDKKSIAISSNVLYSNSRTRQIIVLKNVDTGEENIIYSKMIDRKKNYLKLKNERFIPKAFSAGFLRISKSVGGNLITGCTNNPEIIVYNRYGEEINRFDLKIDRIKITQKYKDETIETVEKYLEKSMQRLKEKAKSDPKYLERIPKYEEQNKSMLEVMRSDEYFPEYMPYFYHLMTDSDGNILIFIYTDNKEELRFQAYTPDGKYVCETKLDMGHYSLKYFSRFKNIAFYNGDLYCLLPLEETQGIPLRLIKVNLSGRN